MLDLRAYRLDFRLTLAQVYRQALPIEKTTKGYLMQVQSERMYQQILPIQKTIKSGQTADLHMRNSIKATNV